MSKNEYYVSLSRTSIKNLNPTINELTDIIEKIDGVGILGKNYKFVTIEYSGTIQELYCAIGYEPEQVHIEKRLGHHLIAHQMRGCGDSYYIFK